MSLKSKIQTVKFFFKPRKFVAQYKLFFGDEWLEASVDSIAKYMYKILFVISDVAWGDDIHNPKIKGDDLTPIIEKLQAKYPGKIIVYKGSWNTQFGHVQAGLDYIKQKIPEATHCLYIDGDEIYREDQLRKLLDLSQKLKTFNAAIRININTYFKTINYRVLSNKEPLLLVLFPLLFWVSYRNARNVNARIVERTDLFFEHPSYVRENDEKMRLKIMAHKESEPILGDWYNEIWLNWSPEMKNFHPTNPSFWPAVEFVENKNLPPEMIDAYKNFKIKG